MLGVCWPTGYSSITWPWHQPTYGPTTRHVRAIYIELWYRKFRLWKLYPIDAWVYWYKVHGLISKTHQEFLWYNNTVTGFHTYAWWTIVGYGIVRWSTHTALIIITRGLLTESLSMLQCILCLVTDLLLNVCYSLLVAGKMMLQGIGLISALRR